MAAHGAGHKSTQSRAHGAWLSGTRNGAQWHMELGRIPAPAGAALQLQPGVVFVEPREGKGWLQEFQSGDTNSPVVLHRWLKGS